MMHHLGDVDMGYGISDAEAKKQQAMSASQLAAYRQQKEDAEQDLQVVGTGMCALHRPAPAPSLPQSASRVASGFGHCVKA
jgi:hypothetical protein